MPHTFSPIPTPDLKLEFSAMEWLRQLAYFTFPKSLPTTASATLSNSPDNVTANATAGALTFSLPAIAAMPTNQIVEKHFKKTDASGNTVTIVPAAGNTIEGAGTYVLATQYKSVTLYSNGIGTVWYIKCAT
jgi:hypothetical protein